MVSIRRTPAFAIRRTPLPEKHFATLMFFDPPTGGGWALNRFQGRVARLPVRRRLPSASPCVETALWRGAAIAGLLDEVDRLRDGCHDRLVEHFGG